MHNSLTLEGNMGNDNIRKEIEKIKQEINKEVRGKGKWIGDKYVYTPLHKETLYQKVILWVFVILVCGLIYIHGGGLFCVFFDEDKIFNRDKYHLPTSFIVEFCSTPVHTREWWVDKIGFDFVGWFYQKMTGSYPL